MSITQQEPTGLVLASEQTAWTGEQRKALEHIGVEHAEDGDLQVFLHVCKRTGLDPFARQIYMIGRKENQNVNGQWVEKYKQTIQTGIDGFRLIARRAADAAGHTISVASPEWCHITNGWQHVWSNTWGRPVAARVTIHRDGQPFTAVALFDEYAGTKKNGDLTRMWAQRPAGQLAKCAEALAWRMAFPQDLSGLYTSEEMGQADNGRDVPDAQVEEAPATTQEEPADVPAETVDVSDGELMLNPRSALAKAMFAALGEAGISDKAERLDYCSGQAGREIKTSSDLTEDEARKVIDSLKTEEPSA
ncbi:MAG TPA: phage recombination protein Bet [Jiangellaceae bacterium]